MAKITHFCKTLDPCNCAATATAATDLRYDSLVKVHFQGGNFARLPVLPEPTWGVEEYCLGEY